MTTARDLLIVAMDVTSGRPVEPGDLSLALAGAEAIDLLGVRAIGLDDDHILPTFRPAIADRLLDEAASSLARQPPYESVGDWLWRRGRSLSAAYMTALEEDGQLTRRRRWTLFGTSQAVLADSLERRLAGDRWTSQEPTLAALAAALGIRQDSAGDPPSVDDDEVATVLAAVNDAITELAIERQRRAVDEAAFDNIWRGG